MWKGSVTPFRPGAHLTAEGPALQSAVLHATNFTQEMATGLVAVLREVDEGIGGHWGGREGNPDNADLVSNGGTAFSKHSIRHLCYEKPVLIIATVPLSNQDIEEKGLKQYPSFPSRKEAVLEFPLL